MESLKGKQLLCGAYNVKFSGGKSSASLEDLESFSSEIGMHGFEDEDLNFIHPLPRKESHDNSDGESICDEENDSRMELSFTSVAAKDQSHFYQKFESKNQDEACKWSTVVDEANKLACVGKKSHSFLFISDVSEARKSSRDVRRRGKHKFSFRLPLHPDELSCSYAVKDRHEKSILEASEGPAGKNNLEHGPIENSVAEQLENLEKGSDELPTTLVSHEQRRALPSIAELLEDLQKKHGPSDPSQGSSSLSVRAKGREIHLSGKRSFYQLGTRILDTEDPLEYVRGETSSEDEEFDQNRSIVATQNIKGQTMVDLFQEAFSTSTVEVPLLPKCRQAGTGYYGRLQQVMQIEKDRHLEFLKQSQTGQIPFNDSGCIVVQILSRFLEAKLTVCHCLLRDNTMSSSYGNTSRRCVDHGENLKRTIIFSSRVCDNVELEAGNLVRIHPPWYVLMEPTAFFPCL